MVNIARDKWWRFAKGNILWCMVNGARVEWWCFAAGALV